MDLKTFLSGLPNEAEREAFARSCNTTLGNLRNCIYTKGKRIGPATCVLVERATGGVVGRKELRPDDWRDIWPELIGTEGAPAVPTASQPEPVSS